MAKQRMGFDPDNSIRKEDSEENEVGFLDHLVDMEEGLERLTESARAFGSKTEELTEITTSTDGRIKDLQKRSGRGISQQMRVLVMGFGRNLSSYAKFLSTENEKYGSELARTHISLEAVLKTQVINTQEDREELERFLFELSATESATEEALSGINSMTDSLRDIPSLERTFNRAQKGAVKELNRFANNVEQTKSMIAHIKEIMREKLNKD